jgi:hypothetical protein
LSASRKGFEMVRLIAHPVYAWIGVAGAKLSALAGIASAVKDEDIMNMDAGDWFLLSGLYMLFVVAALLARLVRKAEAEDSHRDQTP